jgi:hypothetical protein
MIDQQAAREGASAIDRLMALSRWALEMQLGGEMPTVPSQNSSLRAELVAHKTYLELLVQVSDRMGAWILQAQADGDIDPTLPPELVLYTIYARACDPVPAYLKAGGAYADAKIVELVQRTCWNGLRPAPKG